MAISKLPTRQVGRPSKLDEETKRKFFSGIRSGLTIDDAASVAGITGRTIHEWKSRGEKEGKGEFFQFFQECNRVRDEAIAKALQSLQVQGMFDQNRFEEEVKTDGNGEVIYKIEKKIKLPPNPVAIDKWLARVAGSKYSEKLQIQAEVTENHEIEQAFIEKAKRLPPDKMRRFLELAAEMKALVDESELSAIEHVDG